MTTPQFTDAELLAYLDEALPSETMPTRPAWPTWPTSALAAMPAFIR